MVSGSIATPEPRNLWERQAEEKRLHFVAFQCYLEQPPAERTLAAAYREYWQRTGTGRGRRKAGLGPPARETESFNCWSHANNWEERAAAWDDELVRAAAAIKLERMENVTERHTEVVFAMLEKALARIQTIPVDELKASDVSQWVKHGIELERLVRGLTTDSTETIHKLDDEQAGKLARAIRSNPTARDHVYGIIESLNRSGGGG